MDKIKVILRCDMVAASQFLQEPHAEIPYRFMHHDHVLNH